jgi:hypothetical protein
MSLNDDLAFCDSPYTLVSVDKTKAPQGSEGGDWCQYLVERDGSTIVGCMRGTLKQVTDYAKDFVEKLNVRSNKRANYSTWAPIYKKTAKPVTK